MSPLSTFFGMDRMAKRLRNGVVRFAFAALAIGMLPASLAAQVIDGDCIYTLTLFDKSGNGWDGTGIIQSGTPSTVDMIIGGVHHDGLTLLGVAPTVSFTYEVNNGEIVQLIYHSEGGDYDNRYTLTDCYGNLIFYTCLPYPGPFIAPVPGLAYSAPVNCGAARPTDCRGGITVCGFTHVSNTVSTFGCTQDVEGGRNTDGFSCLIDHEIVGTWYYFSPTEVGNLDFTITPDSIVPEDGYNFSLWGPFANAQCPDTWPIRCGNGSVTDRPTGLNSTLAPGDNDYDDEYGSDGWASELLITPGDVGKVYALYIQGDDGSGEGQHFNLDFSGPALNCSVLPIELLDLYAQARENSVDVIWATASERNSERYEVQRSFDDSSYTTIGTLPAAGDADYITYYAFTDEAPGPGANYYRLKEVDRDGAVTITRTVVALMNGSQQTPLLFPNPATETLNVTFTAFKDGTAVLSVRDALGRIVKEQDSAVQRGQPTVRIPMDDLQPGCYSLSVTLPTGIVARAGSFVKQ